MLSQAFSKTVLANLTNYSVKPQRLSLADKEEKRIQLACKESLVDHKDTEAKFFVATLDCIISN